MPSLSGYDKGKSSFHGRTYRADINAHLDFQERLWSPVKARKKRLPRTYFCLGNHEHRITRALEYQPELDGTIGLADLNLEEWYDHIAWYEGSTPGTVTVDGVLYAHYLVSGVSGRPIGGEHPATSLIGKSLTSATVGHLHTADWSRRTTASGKPVLGLFAGCFQDYSPEFAGNAADKWWRGVCVKRNVEDGNYDLQMISIDSLKKEYAR